MLQMPLRPAAPRECLPTQRTLGFSGNAVEKITNSALDEVVVTDTIPLRQDALGLPEDQTVVLLFSSGLKQFLALLASPR